MKKAWTKGYVAEGANLNYDTVRRFGSRHPRLKKINFQLQSDLTSSGRSLKQNFKRNLITCQCSAMQMENQLDVHY